MIKRLIAMPLALFLLVSACQSQSIKPTIEATRDTPLSSTEQVDTPIAEPQNTKTVSPTLESPSPQVQLPSDTPTNLPVATPTNPDHPSSAIIIDHTSVELFEKIPEEYLIKAKMLRMMYADASVGQNISDALNCLAATSWSSSSPACRNDYIDADWNWKTFNKADFDANRVPERIRFSPDPIKYDRSNWIFEPLRGDWYEMTKGFVDTVGPSYLDRADVLSFQFNYFHVNENSSITDPEKGFFVSSTNRTDITELEAFIAEHPDKTFFYWTTSLAREIGSKVGVEFNNQMRQYALDKNLILFDVADIESYTDQGQPCFDNRDGVEYCGRRADGQIVKCENEPDDQVQLPAVCQDYTTEPDGGHLGSVSAGGLRLAKALWVLMARIAGWKP